MSEARQKRGFSPGLAPLWWVVAAMAMALSPCGCNREPDSYGMVREVGSRLQKVADSAELQTWLKHELALHADATSNRPTTVEVQEFPGWLYDLDVLHQPRVTLILDRDQHNDHLSVLWARQGDQVGILIGRDGFKAAEREPGSYSIQHSPGVFVWCPK